MPITITRRIELDYGHVLPHYIGFCNQLHGHRATVLASFFGNIQSSGANQGMVEDFSVLKSMMMKRIHAVLDHGFAVWKDDKSPISIPTHDGLVFETTTLDFVKSRNERILITEEPPTAEYLCKYFFNELYDELLKHNAHNTLEGTNIPPIGLSKLVWYETPNNYAECSV